MKVIVGLGNPGPKYEQTRHNVGFDLLDAIARRWGAEAPRSKFESLICEGNRSGERYLLVAPQTYMNLSGRAVQQAVAFFKATPADVLVLCDDLNLPLGQLRLRGSGTSGGQKGLQNILQQLGTEAVARLRLGIGRPPANLDAADYVLARFSKSEQSTVEEMVQRGVFAVETWFSEGLAAAMNRVNPAVASESTAKPARPAGRPQRPDIGERRSSGQSPAGEPTDVAPRPTNPSQTPPSGETSSPGRPDSTV